MTIPTDTVYPKSLDSDSNLYEVHDGLRVRLLQDYNPGDLFILTEGDTTSFPSTGIVTLTEQQSDIDKRAISLHYDSKDENGFYDLELLEEFDDYKKPKKITNVTQNVISLHHNIPKNSLIEIEKFVGVKGTIDKSPFGETIEGRLNFLRNMVFTPRAWFSVDTRIGLVEPNGLEVTFTNKSFRTGSGPVTYLWDFGDSTISNISSTISETTGPVTVSDVLVEDLDGGEIKKIYYEPNIYDVSLQVTNEFGTDKVTFKELINARIEAPNEAIMEFIPNSLQELTAGTPENGPYTSFPRIRTAANNKISIEIPSGENPNTPGRAYSGEILNESLTPIDPITSYTWDLRDDLEHNNQDSTKSSYSIGGIYDLRLRVDTQYGAYRITEYKDAIDVVEKTNLWSFNFEDTNIISSSEFGLFSETFKSKNAPLTIIRDDSFLDDTLNEEQAKREFKKNTGFTRRGTTSSGDHGTSLLFWASGGDDVTPLSNHTINWTEHNGFSDTYTTDGDVTISHPWNWMFLSNQGNAYFTFGSDTSQTANTNSSHAQKTTVSLIPSIAVTDTEVLGSSNFQSGASELTEHVTSGYTSGEPDNGRFAVYRSTWKDSSGYFLRNDNVGDLFKIKSFYRTQGTISDPFQEIKKLPDIQGTIKLEGELVTLTNGVFFFNNTGSLSAYNDTSGTWETGGPTSNASAFRSFQDTTQNSFDSAENTLLATSDDDLFAYLSFDYTENSFIKFNGSDLTFSRIGSRPSGNQWILGIY